MQSELEHERQTPRRRKSKRHAHTRLVGLRINEGLSPNDLARRAGVSGQIIRMAEAGYVPGPRVQFAIAAVFELRPLDLWPIERQTA